MIVNAFGFRLTWIRGMVRSIMFVVSVWNILFQPRWNMFPINCWEQKFLEMIFVFLPKQPRKIPLMKENSFQNCLDFNFETVEHVDLNRVRETWLSWTNAERTNGGWNRIRSIINFSRTATIWSEQAAEQGSISHKRSAQQSVYYDYCLWKTGFLTWTYILITTEIHLPKILAGDRTLVHKPIVPMRLLVLFNNIRFFLWQKKEQSTAHLIP